MTQARSTFFILMLNLAVLLLSISPATAQDSTVSPFETTPSTLTPTAKPTKAPSVKSTNAPSALKSTKAPTAKSTKAPTAKPTKAPCFNTSNFSFTKKNGNTASCKWVGAKEIRANKYCYFEGANFDESVATNCKKSCGLC